MFKIDVATGKPLPKVDVKDRRILVLLSENSRSPYSFIGREIHLSRHVAAYRISRLCEKKVISSFYPDIDFEMLGFHLFHVFLHVDEALQNSDKNAFLNHLKTHPNTRGIFEYSDQWDFEWILVARDHKEFNTIIINTLSTYSSHILDRMLLSTVDLYDSILLPYIFNQRKPVYDSASKKIKLDDKDRDILAALTMHPQDSSYDLSKRIPYSHDLIFLRIKKLLSAKVIRRFTISPNLSLLGMSAYTFLIRINFLTRSASLKVRECVKTHPNIVVAEKLVGPWDILFRIIVEKPLDFHNTLNQLKNLFTENIRNYAALVMFKEHYFTPLPPVVINEWP